MIIDTFENRKKYECMHKSFAKAFEFISKSINEIPENGRYVLDGDNLFANVFDYDTVEYTNYEAHKKYIDIQFVADGHETIYYNPVDKCTPTVEFDVEKDYGLYTANVHTVLDAPAGTFAIFFPEDAHAPSLNAGAVSHVKKIVIKVLVED